MILRRSLLVAAPLFGQSIPANKVVDKGPPIEAPIVKEFVGAAHGNLARTKEMLAERPGLINAAWDWGGGDFETALGGASHMGAKEIAVYLLDQGARMDIFAAAMLGKLEIVRAMCQGMPGIHKVLGPHKIPLIAHARRGGSNAVVQFLESQE